MEWYNINTMVKKPLFKLMKGNAMELPIYHQQKIMAKQQSNLSYIKQSYDFKLMILKEFLSIRKRLCWA